ncbi:amidohydrolase family protein [Desulfolithobacter sp.]
MLSPSVIHRASWLVPVSRPVIRDGGLVVHNGIILDLGSFEVVQARFPGAEVRTHPDTILLPGLVNAHIHLELSHLAFLARRQQRSATFTGWIEEMLLERERLGPEGSQVTDEARKVLARQHRDGVIALADIGNTDTCLEIQAGFPGVVQSYLELLGLSRAAAERSMAVLAGQDDSRMCTAHAPYSTHRQLIVALKERARRLGHRFPIHVAEPAVEEDLVCHGRGEIADFLRRRGFWDGSFLPAGIDNAGSVQYLDRLGVLDPDTLCVHCVHVRKEEIQIMARQQVKICLCPGSNRFLGVGRAPVADFLAAGLLPALGTDSLASNPEVSLWREMNILLQDHPAISSRTIVAMATLGGARALGLAQDYGTLEPGRRAAVLAIEAREVHDGDQVYPFLTNGRQKQITWI